MIAFAESYMVPSLKGIWRECFLDGDAYIDFYFQHRYVNENTLVWLEEKKPVAMLTLLPASIFHNGSYKPILYVYAVATKIEWRKRGISSRLLKEINGDSMLVPATELLFDFYDKIGYETAFSIRTVEFEVKPFADNAAGILYLPVTPKDYKFLRDQRFLGEGYVCWNLDAVTYALAENQFNGGFAYKIRQGLKEDIIFGCQIENQIYVRETTLEGSQVEVVLNDLAKKLGCNYVIAKLASDATDMGIISRFGMSTFSLNAVGYLGLALD